MTARSSAAVLHALTCRIRSLNLRDIVYCTVLYCFALWCKLNMIAIVQSEVTSMMKVKTIEIGLGVGGTS